MIRWCLDSLHCAGIPQEILAGSSSSHSQWGRLGRKKKWGDDLTKFGISDGKKFTWCFAARPGWGPEEKAVPKPRVLPPGTQELGSAGKAETLLVPGIPRISLTSPQWSRHISCSPQLPLQHKECSQTGLSSCTGLSAENLLPHREEGKVWAQEKLFHLKSCQKVVTSNREEGGRRRNHIPAPALLHSPAFSWKTFLTSNQGLKGVRLKGAWQEGV